jgi:ABC-type nickel/cobalt efflux system permease component RcnA
VLTTLIVALLLGLRHATDPDHLTAVSTLLLNQQRNGPKEAWRLGLAWGVGHATTLFVFGLPIVLLGSRLPAVVHRIAETGIGVLIIVLSARLLLRWVRGDFHWHSHRHGTLRHAHPHAHAHRHPIENHPAHAHSHADALGRTPLASFGIGLVHGVGGSAGLGVLLVGAMAGRSPAALILLVFAAGTAVSMALMSTAFAYLLNRAVLQARLAELIPLFGAAGVVFGAWYSLGAISAGGV